MTVNEMIRKLSVYSLVALFFAACSSTPVVVTDNNNNRPRETSAVELFEEAGVLWESSADPNYDAIADILEEAVDKDAQYADAWFNLGVTYEALDRQEDAISAYEQAAAVDPEQVDGLSNIARILLEQGREAEAERLLEQVVEVDQFHANANLNLAQIYRGRALLANGGVDTAEADQAINRVRMALAGDATNPHAYEALSSVYFDLGRYELSSLVCLNAIAMGIDSARLHNRLGLIALRQDDVTAAYAQFRESIAIDAQLVEASMNLGAITLSYRDYQTSLESFDRVLSVEPENLDALISRAVALSGLEMLIEAEAGYQRVLSLDDENLSALYNLGVLYQEHLQDYETAVTWFEQYLRADLEGTSELSQDVEQRIDTLRELIQWLREADAADAAVSESEPEDDWSDDGLDDTGSTDDVAPDEGPADEGTADEEPVDLEEEVE